MYQNNAHQEEPQEPYDNKTQQDQLIELQKNQANPNYNTLPPINQKGNFSNYQQVGNQYQEQNAMYQPQNNNNYLPSNAIGVERELPVSKKD